MASRKHPIPDLSRHEGRKPTCSAITLAVAVTVAVACAPSAARAAEPKPSEDRMSIEAKVFPSSLPTAGANVAFCMQNVNRRTSIGQSLLDGDTWVFRADPGCLTFSPISGCPSDLFVSSSNVVATDFTCAVTGDSLLVTY